MKHLEEYLASIGFQTDNRSFQEAEKRLDEMGKKVEELAEKINKSGAPKKLNGFLEAFNKGFLENPRVQAGIARTGKQFRDMTAKIAEGATQAGSSIAGFLTTTGGAVAVTTGGILAAIAAISAAMVALGGIATAIIHKFMKDMANADIEIQKFARRMFTTVENARSLKAVMKQMGLDDIEDLKDVAVNPELRKQFFELRALAGGLTLDKQAQKGFQNIRRLEFAFQKISLTMDYFFATLAAKMGDTLGPLLDQLVGVLDSVTDFIVQNVGPLTSALSQIVGLVARLVTLFLQLSGLMGFVDPEAMKDLGTLLNFALGGLNATLDKFIKAIDIFNETRSKGFGLFGGDKYGQQENTLERLTQFVQRIYEILDQFWKMIQNAFRSVRGLVDDVGKKAGILAKSGTFGPIAQAISNLAPAPGGGGKASIIRGTRVNDNILKFLDALKIRTAGGFHVTSGISARSGRSDHPHGRAVDLVPFDKSIKGWADLAQAVLSTPGAKGANIELTAANYMAVMSELQRRKVDTSRVSRHITKDWTGEHIHAGFVPDNVVININGAKSPQATADEVMARLKQKKSATMRATQGMIQ